uniref:Putative secreted protein n=1 Tax=Panstrongylus lignarius TaxID=156445 RepID=A0A224XUB5_9HEMI
MTKFASRAFSSRGICALIFIFASSTPLRSLSISLFNWISGSQVTTIILCMNLSKSPLISKSKGKSITTNG